MGFGGACERRTIGNGGSVVGFLTYGCVTEWMLAKIGSVDVKGGVSGRLGPIKQEQMYALVLHIGG